jgi:formylglycine-generating enzyme required for sulfatase activity
MKNHLLIVVLNLITLVPIPSFAGFETIGLDGDVTYEVFSHLYLKDLLSFFTIDRASSNDVLTFVKKEKLIELRDFVSLLELKSFIHLADNPEWKELKKNQFISHIPITQGAWISVMKNNPSRFKESRYCSEYGAIDNVTGCLLNPVENVALLNNGSRDSIEEFLSSANELLEIMGIELRLFDLAEYEWAARGDKLDSQFVSGNDISELCKFSTYFGVSNRDPKDINLPSFSGEQQTNPAKARRHNAFGFYVSSVSEWTRNTDRSNLNYARVGSGWAGNENLAALGRHFFQPSTQRGANIGFRVVANKKFRQ